MSKEPVTDQQLNAYLLKELLKGPKDCDPEVREYLHATTRLPEEIKIKKEEGHEGRSKGR